MKLSELYEIQEGERLRQVQEKQRKCKHKNISKSDYLHRTDLDLIEYYICNDCELIEVAKGIELHD